MNRGASHDGASCGFRCLFRVNPIAAGHGKAAAGLQQGYFGKCDPRGFMERPSKRDAPFSVYPAPRGAIAYEKTSRKYRTDKLINCENDPRTGFIRFRIDFLVKGVRGKSLFGHKERFPPAP